MLALFAAPRSRRARLAPHWNWPQTADPLRVVVFSNCQKVALRLNGRALETKPVGEDRSVSFIVAYDPGELVAEGFRSGQLAITNRLVTAEAPAMLRLDADRPGLPADGRSLAHVVASLADSHGNLVYTATDALTVEVAGSGRLLGLDNGDMNDATPLDSRSRKANGGQALLLLQAGEVPGALHVKLSAPGLKPAELTLPVEVVQ